MWHVTRDTQRVKTCMNYVVESFMVRLTRSHPRCGGLRCSSRCGSWWVVRQGSRCGSQGGGQLRRLLLLVLLAVLLAVRLAVRLTVQLTVQLTVGRHAMIDTYTVVAVPAPTRDISDDAIAGAEFLRLRLSTPTPRGCRERMSCRRLALVSMVAASPSRSEGTLQQVT